MHKRLITLEEGDDGEISAGSPSVSIIKATSCGNLYIHIAFREVDGHNKIDSITISGNTKEIPCGGAMFGAMADLLTFAIKRIRNHNEAVLICKALRGHQCNRKIGNKEHILSCADAIARPIMKVLNITENEVWGRSEEIPDAQKADN